jgi:glutathione S-transferase
MLEFYDNDMSVCAQKVRVALAEKGVEYTRVPMDLRAGDQLDPEYLKLNPNGVVPTIVHDGNVIIESTVIIYYLNDAFEGPALNSSFAVEKAKMLQWMILPDGGFHDICGITSFALAFRYQLLEKSEAELQDYFDSLKKIRADRLNKIKPVVELGIEAPVVAPAMKSYLNVVAKMQAALSESEWLAGDTFSLADITMLPYTLRLEHLGLDFFWENKPAVAAWYQRMKERDSFEVLSQYFNPKYLGLMGKSMVSHGERIREILKG